MSYDLAVWTSDGRMSSAQASQHYGRLGEGAPEPDEVDPRIEGFYSELSQQFPSLESVPESELDDSPWSVSPSPAADHVSLAISWSRAKDVFRFVRDLAAKWDLVLFCPQTGNVYHPPRLARPSAFRLDLEDGTFREDPSRDELSACLERVSGATSFAILERSNGHYIQARIDPSQRWVLEWQRGGLDRHFACSRKDLDWTAVAGAFAAFLNGDHAALEEFGWQRIRLQTD
jgi:hypothetical protein